MPTSAVHCCSLTQPPFRFSHNLLAYFSGTLLHSHATAASLQPQSIGLPQRYTVALSCNCRFASATIYWLTSTVHCCSVTQLPFHFGHHSSAYLSATSLRSLTTPLHPAVLIRRPPGDLTTPQTTGGPVSRTRQNKSAVHLTYPYASHACELRPSSN